MSSAARKILIVDDEKELRDVLASTFEKTPYPKSTEGMTMQQRNGR